MKRLVPFLLVQAVFILFIIPWPWPFLPFREGEFLGFPSWILVSLTASFLYAIFMVVVVYKVFRKD